MINTNNPTELDSLKIRIPYRNVEIIDPKLEGTQINYIVETDEIMKEFKNNSLKFKTDGISTRFAIEVMPTNNKGSKKKYLTILINSKLLTKPYLEGITKNNIDVIYKHLMAYNVVRFDLQTLLEGFVTDADFKTDVRCTMEEVQELKKFFIINSKQSNKLGVGYQPFNDKTNQGIQFSNRETKAYKTNPFIKMYHKELELKYHSTEFYKKHIKGQDVKDLVRFETTIKNNSHLKALGITSNTLSHLLNLDDKVKKNILSMSINAHLESNIKQVKKREGMSPSDIVNYNFIVSLMNYGQTFERVREIALDGITDKVAKSRKKSMLNKVYTDYIQGSKKDISTKNIDSILNLIGVDNDKR